MSMIVVPILAYLAISLIIILIDATDWWTDDARIAMHVNRKEDVLVAIFWLPVILTVLIFFIALIVSWPFVMTIRLIRESRNS